jgi:hypothetical protein
MHVQRVVHKGYEKAGSGPRQHSRVEAIAKLNDELRIKGRGGRVVVTQGVHSLAAFDPGALIRAIAAYDQFDADNDPYGEHDFGTFQMFDARLMWKIDYYDLNLEFGSDNPADPNSTVRVLTVMLATEY